MAMNNLTCKKCGLIYKQIQSLRRHLKAAHPGVAPSAVSSNLVCTVCHDKFPNKNDFRNHLSEKHDFISSSFNHVFDSRDDFRAWKSQMEKETGSLYVVARTVKDKDVQLSYFNCCRSGHYTPKGVGIRSLKTQGSKRINGYCPSEIKVKVDTHGKYIVTHFEKHWGHALELQHLSHKAEEPCTQAQAQEPSLDNESSLLIALDDELRTQEIEDSLAQAYADNSSALLTKKQEFADLMNKISAHVESSSCPEEVDVLNQMLTSVLPVMAAVREMSGPNITFIFQDDSNEKQIEPPQINRNVRSTKKEGTKSQPMVDPDPNVLNEIIFEL